MLKTDSVRADTQRERPPSRKARLVPQIAAVFIALLLGTLPLSPTVPTPVTLARLDVTITTTSDWTSVDIGKGQLTLSKEVSRPADVTLFATPTGWSLRAPGKVSRTVVVRAVFEESTLAPSMRISVRKGLLGRTIVDLRNTNGVSFLAGHVANTLTSSVGPTLGALVTQWRTRDQFFGTSAAPLTRGDPARRVLAFYYPWFSPPSYNDPTLGATPAEPFSSQDYPGVLELTKMARAGGIDGFIMSYNGSANGRLEVFDNVLRAAEQEGSVAAPFLEIRDAHPAGEAMTKPAVVLDWLREVLARSNSTAFLRSGGEPVVFVYEMARVGVIGWQKILDALALEGRHVRLVGDAPLDTHGAVEWGLHAYNTAVVFDPAKQLTVQRTAMLDTRLLSPPFAGSKPHLYAATVTPGYDDRNLRGANALAPVVERGANGERYDGSWQAAIGSDPDWVLITSWNEWFEASGVQPSVAYGDMALRQTATLSQRFKTLGG